MNVTMVTEDVGCSSPLQIRRVYDQQVTYIQISQISNLPQVASQSVQHTTPSVFTPTIWITRIILSKYYKCLNTNTWNTEMTEMSFNFCLSCIFVSSSACYMITILIHPSHPSLLVVTSQTVMARQEAEVKWRHWKWILQKHCNRGSCRVFHAAMFKQVDSSKLGGVLCKRLETL